MKSPFWGTLIQGCILGFGTTENHPPLCSLLEERGGRHLETGAGQKVSLLSVHQTGVCLSPSIKGRISGLVVNSFSDLCLSVLSILSFFLLQLRYTPRISLLPAAVFSLLSRSDDNNRQMRRRRADFDEFSPGPLSCLQRRFTLFRRPNPFFHLCHRHHHLPTQCTASAARWNLLLSDIKKLLLLLG